MSGYGFYVEGKLEKMFWAANDTTAMMQAMAIAANSGITQYKVCRIGCEVNGKAWVVRTIAGINDDTVM